jgi:hypothetical protein
MKKISMPKPQKHASVTKKIVDGGKVRMGSMSPIFDKPAKDKSAKS